MTVLKVNEISKALLSKGFKAEKGGDHIFYRFYYEGRRTLVKTKISHSKHEYGENLLKDMSLQLHLERREFEDFIECKLTKDGYAKMLIEKRIISVNGISNNQFTQSRGKIKG